MNTTYIDALKDITAATVSNPEFFKSCTTDEEKINLVITLTSKLMEIFK
jgi:hypothetical protein